LLLSRQEMDSATISKMIQEITLLVPGFLLAVTVHEYAHGYIAYRLGDPTAKMAGRLTFNPISHLDLFGTIALVLTGMIGWAKPVPVDPRYLRNPHKDMLWISVGGPAANIVAAVACALLLHVVVLAFRGSAAGPVSTFIVGPLAMILARALIINIGLAVFNLIPIPPLDGFGVLMGMLSRETAYQLGKIEPYGFIILIGLIVTGAVNIIVRPPIMFLVDILTTGLR